MSNKTPENLRYVTIPEDTDFPDFNSTQRRAFILQEMIDAGYPSALTQREYARKFDVDPAIINRDFHDHVIPEFQELVTESDATDIVAMAKQVVRDAIQNDDLNEKDTMKVVTDYAEMMGIDEPERLEVVQESTSHAAESDEAPEILWAVRDSDDESDE